MADLARVARAVAGAASHTGWPIRSVIALPLRLGGARPLGVLDLYKRERGAPDAASLNVARAIIARELRIPREPR